MPAWPCCVHLVFLSTLEEAADVEVVLVDDDVLFLCDK